MEEELTFLDRGRGRDRGRDRGEKKEKKEEKKDRERDRERTRERTNTVDLQPNRNKPAKTLGVTKTTGFSTNMKPSGFSTTMKPTGFSTNMKPSGFSSNPKMTGGFSTNPKMIGGFSGGGFSGGFTDSLHSRLSGKMAHIVDKNVAVATTAIGGGNKDPSSKDKDTIDSSKIPKNPKAGGIVHQGVGIASPVYNNNPPGMMGNPIVGSGIPPGMIGSGILPTGGYGEIPPYGSSIPPYGGSIPAYGEPPPGYSGSYGQPPPSGYSPHAAGYHGKGPPPGFWGERGAYHGEPSHHVGGNGAYHTPGGYPPYPHGPPHPGHYAGGHGGSHTTHGVAAHGTIPPPYMTGPPPLVPPGDQYQQRGDQGAVVGPGITGDLHQLGSQKGDSSGSDSRKNNGKLTKREQKEAKRRLRDSRRAQRKAKKERKAEEKKMSNSKKEKDENSKKDEENDKINKSSTNEKNKASENSSNPKLESSSDEDENDKSANKETLDEPKSPESYTSKEDPSSGPDKDKNSSTKDKNSSTYRDKNMIDSKNKKKNNTMDIDEPKSPESSGKDSGGGNNSGDNIGNKFFDNSGGNNSGGNNSGGNDSVGKEKGTPKKNVLENIDSALDAMRKKKEELKRKKELKAAQKNANHKDNNKEGTNKDNGTPKIPDLSGNPQMNPMANPHGPNPHAVNPHGPSITSSKYYGGRGGPNSNNNPHGIPPSSNPIPPPRGQTDKDRFYQAAIGERFHRNDFTEITINNRLGKGVYSTVWACTIRQKVTIDYDDVSGEKLYRDKNGKRVESSQLYLMSSQLKGVRITGTRSNAGGSAGSAGGFNSSAANNKQLVGTSSSKKGIQSGTKGVESSGGIKSAGGVFSVQSVGSVGSDEKKGDIKEFELDAALKIMRDQSTMSNAAVKEMQHIQEISRHGPRVDAYGCTFLSTLINNDNFTLYSHKVLVIPAMRFDLRAAQQYYQRSQGFPLSTVALWTVQIAFGLRCLSKLGIIHADLKPDNILVGHSRTNIKITDFGTSMRVTDITKERMIQPRFYRAPEIILGHHYDTQIDVWSFGCCLYELARGDILFNGNSDNGMLKLHLDLKGQFPKEIATKGKYSNDYFTKNGDFKLRPGLTDKEEQARRKENERRERHNNNANNSNANNTNNTNSSNNASNNPADSNSRERDRNYDENDITIINTSNMNGLQLAGLFKDCSITTDSKTQEEIPCSDTQAKAIGDLIEKTLTVDAKRRYTPDDIIEHPFFTSCIDENYKHLITNDRNPIINDHNNKDKNDDRPGDRNARGDKNRERNEDRNPRDRNEDRNPGDRNDRNDRDRSTADRGRDRNDRDRDRNDRDRDRNDRDRDRNDRDTDRADRERDRGGDRTYPRDRR